MKEGNEGGGGGKTAPRLCPTNGQNGEGQGPGKASLPPRPGGAGCAVQLPRPVGGVCYLSCVHKETEARSRLARGPGLCPMLPPALTGQTGEGTH